MSKSVEYFVPYSSLMPCFPKSPQHQRWLDLVAWECPYTGNPGTPHSTCHVLEVCGMGEG